jgi:hypothetical protein
MTLEQLEQAERDLSGARTAILQRLTANPQFVGLSRSPVEYNARENSVRSFQKDLVAEQKLWDLYYTKFQELFNDMESYVDPIQKMDEFLAQLPTLPLEQRTLWSNVDLGLNFADDRELSKKKIAAGIPSTYGARQDPSVLKANIDSGLKQAREAALQEFIERYTAHRDAILRKKTDVDNLNAILIALSRILPILRAKRAAAVRNQAARNEAVAAETSKAAWLTRQSRNRANANARRTQLIKEKLNVLAAAQNKKPGFFSRFFGTRKAAPAPAPAPSPIEYGGPPPADRQSWWTRMTHKVPENRHKLRRPLDRTMWNKMGNFITGRAAVKDTSVPAPGAEYPLHMGGSRKTHKDRQKRTCRARNRRTK